MSRLLRLRSFSSSSSSPSPSTHFGFQSISASEKESKVAAVFSSVASNYDIMNDFMSAGIHRLWKDRFVQVLQIQPGMKVLDVAGGTGDIAFRMIQSFQRTAAGLPVQSYTSGYAGPEVTVCDINEDMLKVGKQRAVEAGFYPGDKSSVWLVHKLEFVQGNAEKLPFESNSMDAYTIAFGLRNVTYIDNALKEAHRVLKRGGRFLCLEFSQVPNPLLRQFYDLYSFSVIPFLGEVVAKDRHSYQYLVESIRKFPVQEDLIEKMQNAGFLNSSYENLSFGIVSIHSGYKL